MDKISAFAKRTGINDHLPELLSMSLGAGETRLIDLTSAYAEIVNGGKKIQPYLIERIQDRYGRTILKQDNRDCAGCNYDVWENQPTPQLADGREQVFDSLSAYQMTSILEGVATRGSGARLRRLKNTWPAKPEPPTTAKKAGLSVFRRIWWSAPTSVLTNRGRSAAGKPAPAWRCRYSMRLWKRR